MDVIPLGIITEQNLVDVFSSSRVRDRYNEVGHFTSGNKKTTLDYAANFCTIAPLPNRKYIISDSFAPYIPFELKLLKTGIYKYITPLLLKFILNHASNRGIESPCCKSVINLAHEIKMVNGNYFQIFKRKNKYIKTETELERVYLYIVNDYFIKVWSQVKYYLTTCLDKLVEAGLITYKTPYYVTYLNHKNEKEHRAAGETDMAFRRKCQLRVLKALKRKTLGDYLKDEHACKYSKDRTLYMQLLESEFLKNKILNFFLCYEIYLIPNSLSQCTSFVKSFFEGTKDSNVDNGKFIEEFNREFIKIITDSVVKRTDTARADPLTFGGGWGDYISTYRRLAEITLLFTANDVNLFNDESDKTKVYRAY